MWGDKRYHTLNYHLRQKFNSKVLKLPFDAGFSCPNRDGSISKSGCIYCSSRGSGDFAGNVNYSLQKQYYQTKKMMDNKWPNAKYIAYFQAFTNTYASIELLRKLYYEALSFENVIGISIATRPDCLSEEIISLLEEISNITYLWVELGLQTVNDKTAQLINRGHTYQDFLNGLNKLQLKKIKTCVHIIYGLPEENLLDMAKTAAEISILPIQGVKFHSLYVLKNTPLEAMYNNNLKLLDANDYINLVVDTIEMLPENIIIHRLTGDPPRDSLISPTWSLNKWELLNSIDKEFVTRNSKQGIKSQQNLLHNLINNNTI